MSTYPIPEEPIFNNMMRMLETTDLAHADLFNTLYGQLLENDEYLKAQGKNHGQDRENPHGVTAVQVGAIPASQKGANEGVAELDGNGRLPSTQLTQHKHPLSDVTDIYNVMLKKIYPIGTILEFGTDIDPNSLSDWSEVGWTWTRFAEGQVTVGYKSGDANFGEIGKTGGDKTVSLVAEQLPPHAHTGPAHVHSGPSHNHAFTGSAHSHRPQNTSCYFHTSTDNIGADISSELSGSGQKIPRSNGDWNRSNRTEAVAAGGTVGYSGTGATGSAGTGATGNGPGRADPISTLQPYKVTIRWIRTS